MEGSFLQVLALGLIVCGCCVADKRAPSRDCKDVLARGKKTSGVYEVQPTGSSSKVKVYCDMNTDGGGWTVFQRRRNNGGTDFYLDWSSYKKGFGNLNREFWLGNDNLYQMTNSDKPQLRVDLKDINGRSTYALYDSFSVGKEDDRYKLALGTYSESATAGDSMSVNNNQRFSTRDKDTSSWGRGCAEKLKSAFWFPFSCGPSNPNGIDLNPELPKSRTWRIFGQPFLCKKTEMKFRRKN